jgi:ribose transport system ATP-binding protein
VTSVVRMEGIGKVFPGVVALDGVDFELQSGEIHALAGENGSGKSTLVKILYGALQADAGTIRVNGDPVSFATPRRAIEHGIVAISQELTLAPTLSVAENVLMGRLPRRRGAIDWPRTRRLAQEALDELGVHVDPRRRIEDLPLELQQEVEVARAVSADSKVLILDEATSALSETATERLLLRLHQLRDRGVAIVFISHRLREVYSCASRVTVLRDGRLIGTVPVAATSEARLVQMMVGREIEDLFNKRQIERGESVLEVRNLTTEDGAVLDASFELRSGEILGVAGLVGCGKNELALALGGAVPSTGEVRVRGRIVALRSPRTAIRAGISLVPDDRKRNAILPTRSDQHNLSAAWMQLLSHFGVLNPARERRLAAGAVTRFGVKTASLSTRIVNLSGGNQQKVVLARWLALAPEVVVLNEPTRGIDVGAKSEVYALIQQMAEGGAGILMISSELPELLGLADRIIVMFRHQVCAEFDAGDVTEEEIAHAALGGEASLEEAV